MSRGRPHISELRFSNDVADKIERKHNLTRAEIEDALLFRSLGNAAWHNHPQYGERLIVRATTRSGARILCYLGPIDEDQGIWSCRTAIRER